VAKNIQEFCQQEDRRDEQNHLIVTCREHSYEKNPDLAGVIPVVARVEPFAPQHMRAFLQGWPSFEGRVALRSYQEPQRDPQIFDICRNPLMLTILTGLYLERDRFELPSSRESFYSTALDELLVARPARRIVHQDFRPDDKRHILQRVALDRLETLGGDEDPELPGRDRLRHCAREVIGRDLKDSDFRALLNELVEVNGVLKPAAEDAFVLGHRTFQEYLAAHEANRTREVSQVLSCFSAKPELSQVLCFYCSVLRNVPQLNRVLQTPLDGGEALLAARCLLYATEVPAASIIEAVSGGLLEAIRSHGSGGLELELLSSLAQRRAR